VSETRPACRALWDYNPQMDDELGFCKGAFIRNVVKYDGDWWRGDYGGKVGKWFPATFCEEINVANGLKQTPDVPENASESEDRRNDLALGAMQKGSLDLNGCIVDQVAGRNQRMFLLSIKSQSGQLECAAESEEDLEDWIRSIREASTQAEEALCRIRELGEQKNIAKELSDLVVYCVTVPFNVSQFDKGKFYEMSSMPENKLERFVARRNYDLRLLMYNRRQLTRAYPKGTRLDSSNYDPQPAWSFGVQLCALNYQTPDRSMQLNNGMFMDNGGCGYVLQPDFMRADGYDPHNKDTLVGVEPWNLRLTILAARHLPKVGRSITTPFVEVEIIGNSYDNSNKFKTRTNRDNGLNPSWNHTFDFDVICPPIAKIRFHVQDEDMFGDSNFIGQAVFPLGSLKTGYRSIPLKNSYGEEILLSSLLVHLEVRNAKDDEEYASIQQLRDQMQNLMERQGLNDEGERESTTFQEQIAHYQSQLSQLTHERHERHEARHHLRDYPH